MGLNPGAGKLLFLMLNAKVYLTDHLVMEFDIMQV